MTDSIYNFFDIHPWILIALIAHGAILGTVAYLILLERKVASWVQDRIGPNRVGLGFGIIPWLKDKKMGGLGQPLADGLKFIVKEDYRPGGTDKILFSVAPAVMILVIIVSVAVIPWGGVKQSSRDLDATDVVAQTAGITRDAMTTNIAERAGQTGTPEHAAIVALAQSVVPASGTLVEPVVVEVSPQAAGVDGIHPATIIAAVKYRYPFQIASLNIGVLFILAVLALAVYGVVIGGWASNNKYSFLGGLRATAQMISYEIPLGLCVLCIVVMFGTLDLGQIVDRQAHYWFGFIPAWNIFSQPLTFLMFLVCIHAEANRAPFDLAEAEQELVGGYHTEYSAMRFALFFLSEYAGMITTSALCVALFFGGWHMPFVDHLTCGVVNLLHKAPWNDPRGAWVDATNPSVTSTMAVCLVRAVVFYLKTLVVIFIFMWTRWSLPRFRFDQLMMIAWRAMIPMSLALLLVTSVLVYFFETNADPFAPRVSGVMAVALLIVNVAILGATMALSVMIPAPLPTNRRLKVSGSRFDRTPLPGTATVAPLRAADEHPAAVPGGVAIV